jgi:UDP-glucose 4-epimerase
MSTIIILGGGGFLAGHIARHYQKLGWRVVSVGRAAAAGDGHARHVWNLPHPEFGHLLAVEQPSICVNAAGLASVPASMVEPLADFESSTLLNYRILDDLRRRSPATIYIHLSSAAVYGNSTTLPIDEYAPIAPISSYGWHKRLSEIIMEEHTNLFGLKTASLRIFSAFGAGLQRQVVWDLAVKVHAASSSSLMLQGCPDDSRDFIHGSDVASAITIIAQCGELRGECYNVASGREARINDLAVLIGRLLKRDPILEFDNIRRPGNPGRWHADITKICSLGFEPKMSLEQGAAEVVGEVIGLYGR